MPFATNNQLGVEKKLCLISFTPVMNPNLPEGRVKMVAIGEPYLPLLHDRFEELGIAVIPIPNIGSVALEVRGHADLALHHVGGYNIIASSDTYSRIQIRLSGMDSRFGMDSWNIIPSLGNLSPKYPGDIALNALRIGRYLFCNMEHTDVRLLEYCEKYCIEVVNVKQGYTKCSVCVVQEDAAITSDPQLAEVMVQKRINVLVIEPGYIDLEGYDYGFIGGASGKIAADTLCFTGSLKNHPSNNSICDFLKEHGVNKVELTERRCFDIGSIIPLIEIF